MQPPRGVNHQIPLLGQRQQQAQTQISAAIQQLAMQIYTRRASNGIPRTDVGFQNIAKDSLRAARCYFEGIGVIEEEKETSET